RFASTPRNPSRRIAEFFVLDIPAALYRIRWLSLAIAGAFLLIAGMTALWVSSSPELMAVLARQADLESYAKSEFVDYYSNYSGESFTAQVWTNNARIAALSIAFGITGVFPVYLIMQNAQSIGTTAAIMAEYDRLDVFFQFIAPHGQLEMYSIFVAGAAGLQIFWAWIAPGPRTRGAAL